MDINKNNHLAILKPRNQVKSWLSCGSRVPSTTELTGCWGDPVSVSSFLDRCQVDTPAEVVRSTWEHVRKLRPGKIGKVVDLGAGDGRFAQHGNYCSYIGYEIDSERCSKAQLPKNARVVNQCAFSELKADADVCVGNPPFVRYQDIPDSWREHVHTVVKQQTGVHVSGLANAWQYFFLHGLASLKADGLAAIVVPSSGFQDRRRRLCGNTFANRNGVCTCIGCAAQVSHVC